MSCGSDAIIWGKEWGQGGFGGGQPGKSHQSSIDKDPKAEEAIAY